MRELDPTDSDLGDSNPRRETWIGFDEWNTMQSTGTTTPDAVRYMCVIHSSMFGAC